MMNAIVENQLINRLTEHFRHSPLQVNRLHESDAEIIALGPDICIALTTDNIVEEIATGLYDNPYLIGWMTVMVNMSDLAAVGAEPIGILVSETLPRGYDAANLSALQKGIADACSTCATYVLGGDTNFGESLMLGGCAIGSVSRSSLLTRVGCNVGDLLYASGMLGGGNAFAISKLLDESGVQLNYLPCARLKEVRTLRGIASACMDTSDGVLATLDQMMRLNGVGFEIDVPLENILSVKALSCVQANILPPWFLLAGQHGEFELLFTVPPVKEYELLHNAEQQGWQPVRLGSVVADPAISLLINNHRRCVDTKRIRNIAYENAIHVKEYIGKLMELDREIRKGEVNHVCS
jgi:thiamine-monophosphate kinase